MLIEESGNGNYSIMFDDRDGMFYYAEQNVLLLVNGGYDGETLHLADKAAYDGVGSY